MNKASCTLAAMKIKIDENEADAFSKVKKINSVATEQVKRAALGDLQNRAALRNISAKEASIKDIKANVKPRVDSHWKKCTAHNNTNNLVGSHKPHESCKVGVSNTSAAAVAQRRVLTRSNSIRLGVTNKTTHGTDVVNGTLQNKPKTLTTKVIESKAQVKANVSKTNKDEKPVIAIPPLRREDSNLSRKSLSKLKAALARDAAGATKSSKTVTTTAEPVVVVKERDTKIAPVSRSNSNTSNSSSSTTTSIKETEKPKFQIVEASQTHSSKLLSDVEDIDSDDADNLVLVSDYVNDIYNYLYSLEDIHSIRPKHLANNKEIFPKMRAVLIDWINEVHTQFHCVAETFQMAVAIIDRYLQAVNDTKRSHLQLVGVTALFIAAKYEELFPPAISDFVYITDETYTAEQIFQMEMKIMKVIDFNLSRPLPLHFLRRFSKAANAEDAHHAMAKYFLELALNEYDLAHYKPSEIAAASTFLSLHLINGNSNVAGGFDDSHWTPTLQWYSHYSADHLRPIAKQIATIARNAPKAKLKSVYTKYQAKNLLHISLRPELTSKLMDSIVNSGD